MNQQTTDLILSRAHEWVQKLPLRFGTVVCTRCGIETKISNLGIERCIPHFERKSSGYLPEC